MKQLKIDVLLGQTLISATGVIGGSSITFESMARNRYVLYHEQDCCERVYVEDIVGNLQDLVGNPILRAEEINSEGVDPVRPAGEDDSYTWTFYKLATIKGSVTIRFYGTSNGYYSESVNFGMEKEEQL